VREEAERNAKNEFQQLAQKIARASHLTASSTPHSTHPPRDVRMANNTNANQQYYSTSTTTHVQANHEHQTVPILPVNNLPRTTPEEDVPLTPMQRLIKLDEVQKEVYRKEQEQKQLLLQKHGMLSSK
jgi:hypothetical protein